MIDSTDRTAVRKAAQAKANETRKDQFLRGLPTLTGKPGSLTFSFDQDADNPYPSEVIHPEEPNDI